MNEIAFYTLIHGFLEEREKLVKRLEWLGIRSNGADEIIKDILVLDIKISSMDRDYVPDRSHLKYKSRKRINKKRINYLLQ